MYARAFQDPDGHIWESFFMDEEAMKAATQASRPRD
jgi:predicted lactoylglutathione lyase